MSWKAWFLAKGETQFASNGVVLATKEEAEAYARDLYSRWMGAEKWQVQTSDHPVNARWDKDQGKLVWLTRDLHEKLKPTRFSDMSGKMTALVAHIIDATGWTDPAINDLVVTSDDMVMAQHEGDLGHNHFIGSLADLRRNWTELLKAAGLNEHEHAEAERLYHEKVKRHG